MSETLQILEKLNGLYANAFAHLIAITIGILAFAGIGFPLLISWIQNRQMKRDQNILSKQIIDSIADAEKKLREEILSEMAKEEEKLKAHVLAAKADIQVELSRMNYSHTGRVFHLQASQNSERKHHALCIMDCGNALENYCLAKEERNVQAIIGIFRVTWDHVYEADFNNIVELEPTITRGIEALDNIDANGRYTTDVFALRKALANSKKRVKNVTPA